jgi:hypothetical protein
MDVGVAVQPEGNLLEVVRTLRTVGGAPHPSEGGQHQANKYDHEPEPEPENHQQVEKRESLPTGTVGRTHGETPGLKHASSGDLVHREPNLGFVRRRRTSTPPAGALV